MRYCDLTLAYTATSGGIRTYIDAKRRYLKEHTDDEHVLIVPGEKEARQSDGRLTIRTLAGPLIPGCAPYRFFWHPLRLLEALEEEQPDVVELGSFFACPWAAFQYRKHREGNHLRCLVSGYFHTDLADAYFGSPLREVLHDHLSQSGELLSRWGLSLAEAAEFGAERYFGSIFARCDLVFAASPAQLERLRHYMRKQDEDRTRLVPLGVDIELFHPGRRSDEVRARLGATADTILILYGGRLDAEKHVETLVAAFEDLRSRSPHAKLLVTGEGPLRKKLEERAETLPGFLVRPYATSREEFATLLASADLYATAGPHETFGLSVVEAQASGLPVVGVDAGALRERVVPGTGFLVPVDDAPAMARQLEAAAREREAMGARARRHVIEAGLDWNGTFRALFAAYQGVLGA
jgi:alpha-1,6-mannosyltransferase